MKVKPDLRRALIKCGRISRRLFNEGQVGSVAWKVFLESNGPLDDPSPRDPLRELLADTHEGHAFGWIQDICVGHTMLAICRATDMPNGSRATLLQLRNYFQNTEIVDALTEMRLRHSKRLGLSTSKRIASGVGENCNAFIDGLTKSLKDNPISAVRAKRHELAHNLIGHNTTPPLYFDIQSALDQVVSLTRLSQAVVFGFDTDVQQFAEVNQRYAKRFWNTFQLGLNERRSTSR